MIPKTWHFTEKEANGRYANAIKNSKSPLPTGVPKTFLKCKVNGDWFYRVSHLNAGERRNFERDLWASYGFYTHFNPKFNDGIYVRRK